MSVYLESGLDIVPELLLIHRDVVLGQPVAEEDGPSQRLLLVDVGEVFHGNRIHVLIRPHSLLIQNQPVESFQSTYLNLYTI